jgi:hypothetical protein
MKKEYNNIPFKNAAIDRLTSMTTSPKSNRGDRMAERGEKKIAKATANLDNSINKAVTKAESKVSKLESKYGPAPKMGQEGRINAAKNTAGKASREKWSYDLFNQPQPRTVSKYDNDKMEMTHKEVYDAPTPFKVKSDNPAVIKAQQKKSKGDFLVEKGQKLSKHINYRKQPTGREYEPKVRKRQMN